MAIRFRVRKVNPQTREPLQPGISMAFVDLPSAEEFVKNSPRVWAVDPTPVHVAAGTSPVPPAVTGRRTQVQASTPVRNKPVDTSDRDAGLKALQKMMGSE